MGVQERILTYLSVYGKANKYKIARALKTDVSKVTNTLSELREEGKIEIKSGNAILVKGKKPITTKARKQKKQPRVEVKEEKPKEEPEEEGEEEKKEKVEEPKEEPTEEEPEETKVSEEVTKEKTEEVEEKPAEKEVKEERIEGTVKFFNPNKGFGFITGDDGKDYYVHESSLKEGVTIEAEDRVSFKAAEGDKGPKAEEVEKISQSSEENVA